ncbi:DEAD/DEAH box helicase [Teredinibacter haidensis]|uniref:DEAD/DEAH box helicase n=1 Tax=Teredinibacter haidensis TaxID=2731755 RepID=UPI0009491430|nr:DEAD/DEAH box helicase [Teredinibacter haidensis]
MPEDTNDSVDNFADLNLPGYILKALSHVGYETPSPIQAATIPALIKGGDLLGMAQTGTGKTAAFALPILANIDLKQTKPQALVLCPTRELALQVAEAFQAYASEMKGFHVMPIYGGHDMRAQLRGLQRGVHVIVGTPGRLLDHLDRRSLDLSQLKTLVLDEADEMLRMGFNEDVEAILDKTPGDRQIALFSATMPPPIRRVADKYLKKPTEIRIESAVATNENIEQHYWLVSGTNKLEALTRILEVEEFDGMLIFVRTKTATADLSEKLNARGFSAAPLNGDMNQALRQRTVEQLKNGQLDMVIATDVAARGLDVDRISHVLNYDIPYDDEAYVHRIGRTGRAGRKGKAILFVAPRERRMLRSIENTTRQKITQMHLPSRDDLIDRRAAIFKSSVAEALNNEDKSFFQRIVGELCHEQEASPEDIAAALAYLLQKDRPLLPPKDKPKKPEKPTKELWERGKDSDDKGIPNLGNAQSLRDYPEIVMERFRIAVGHNDEVTPREIVGAIANEADIDGRYIGHIKIYDAFSTVDLPAGMPNDLLSELKKTRVKQRPINIERVAASSNTANNDAPNRPRKPRKDRKPRHTSDAKRKRKDS